MGWVGKYTLVFGFVVIAAQTAFSQASDEGGLVLYRSHVECLREHAGKYLKFVSGPTLIYLGFCQSANIDPTPEEVAAATSENAFAQSSIMNVEGPSGQQTELARNEKAALAVLTPEQFTCLTEHYDEIAVFGSFIDDNGRDVEIAEVFFDRC